MKGKCVFIVAMLVLVQAAEAQQSSKFKFHSINNVGLLEGGSDESLQLQTINGVNYKSFFAGLGLGLDNYHFRSVTVFADVRKNLSGKKLTPFVYADLGAGFPWDKRTASGWSKSRFETGFLYDLGLGYTVPVKGRFAINASIGYSQKFLEERRVESYWIWRDFPPYGPAEPSMDTSYYNYTFRRFSFRIGISF